MGNGGMVVSNQLRRTWKVVVVASLKLLLQYLQELRKFAKIISTLQSDIETRVLSYLKYHGGSPDIL
jgi:hypothetical protein